MTKILNTSKSRNTYDNLTSINAIAPLQVLELEDTSAKEADFSTIATGFTKLDNIISGFQSSEFIIVAGPPAGGKTLFALSLARNIAIEQNNGVAFFSLEMSAQQLLRRLISMELGLNSMQKDYLLSPEHYLHLDDKLEPLANAPIFIDHTPSISISEFRSKAMYLKKELDIKLILIDYLQLMSGNIEARGSHEQEVADISQSLKTIAKELNVPIVALLQLSRSVDSRIGSEHPQLSDIPESSMADVVLFIHQPKKLLDEYLMSTRGVAEIIVTKHHNKTLGTAKLTILNGSFLFANSDPRLIPDWTEGITYPSLIDFCSILDLTSEENRCFVYYKEHTLDELIAGDFVQCTNEQTAIKLFIYIIHPKGEELILNEVQKVLKNAGMKSSDTDCIWGIGVNEQSTEYGLFIMRFY